MTAIQRIDRKKIENQQAHIDVPDRTQEAIGIRHRQGPAERAFERNEHRQNRDQHNIDEWARGDAPKRRSGAWRRVDIGHSAKGPEHDPIRDPSNLAARERMTKLVKHHNDKQRQILEYIPGERRVRLRPIADFVHGDEKPRPMHE